MGGDKEGVRWRGEGREQAGYCQRKRERDYDGEIQGQSRFFVIISENKSLSSSFLIHHLLSAAVCSAFNYSVLHCFLFC